jgi:hypothetical protein
MLPPAFESIVHEFVGRFRACVTSDSEGIELPNLLIAEEVAGRMVRQAGCALIQAFVDVRTEHALARRERCPCGQIM